MTPTGHDRPLPRRAFLAGVVGAAATACTPGPASSAPAVTGGTSNPAAGSSGATLTTTASGSESASPPGSPGGPTTASTTPTPAGVAALRGSLRGHVVLPADSGYATAARLFNPRYDGARPVAIAYCASVDDVRRCVDAARADGVTPIVRAGGHSYAGYSTGSGLVIDVTGLQAVRPTGGEVTVDAGARLFHVYEALGALGTAIPGGSCATVGVAGLTLGGGLGIEGREYGLTSDRLLAVDVVLASGELVTATATDNADLFWACRGGGGGNFGVVTQLRFATHRTSDLTRWQLRWPWAHAADVLQGWTGWVGASPRQLFSAVNCSSTVGVVHPSVTVFGVLHGPPAQATSLMADLTRAVGSPVVSTYLRTSSHQATVRQLSGCADLTDEECGRYGDRPGSVLRQAYAGGSDLLRGPLDAAGAGAIVAAIDARQLSGLATGTVLIDSLGGAIDDIPAAASAYVHRGALASLQYLANWNLGDPQRVIDANLAWFAAAKRAVGPHMSGEAYQNYIDAGRADWRQAYYGANYDRLVQVKKRVDPDRLFTFAQAVGA